MKIGEFKHRIKIIKPVIQINDNGFEVETYETYKTLWSKVTNLHGKEYFEAAAIQKEKTLKFTFRLLKDINENMKIEFNHKLYDINFIDNILYENKYMEIKAMEVDESD